MGFKKNVVTKLGQTLMKGALRHPSMSSYIKKIILAVTVLFIFLFIGAFFLIGFGIKHVGQMVSQHPLPEIVALERLISEKTIILTEEQKTKIIPLLKQLVKLDQNQGETQKLKKDILTVLNDEQLESIKLQQQKTAEEAKGLVYFGRSALDETIKKFTGITMEGQNLLKSISAWWQLNVSNNEATQNLLKQMEKPQ